MVHDEQAIQAQVVHIGERLQARQGRLAVAESCTGGWLAKVLTDTPGASLWFERALIVYSNAAKAELLGVPPELIERCGAVSEAVAEALAVGLLQRAPVSHTIAVTGIAGPEGGSAEKPVGTVWIAWAVAVPSAAASAVQMRCYRFKGDRQAVRRASVAAALAGLEQLLSEGASGAVDDGG
ncbi:damage-inducible protein CinA [Halorhodospira abdelmalekii]|uniref:CinA family protein n=1 Tax=Halorhodospira abdelmalekii TaxID=421629 RepID=UPI0019035E5A|nr:CinA family protein [Halorhodospira abdelmalekii]MBK1735743.1 damage-inducible protein CinA [Halorhodospira abdelmalekii]